MRKGNTLVAILAILLSLSMPVSLVGCNGSKGGETAGAASAESSGEANGNNKSAGKDNGGSKAEAALDDKDETGTGSKTEASDGDKASAAEADKVNASDAEDRENEATGGGSEDEVPATEDDSEGEGSAAEDGSEGEGSAAEGGSESKGPATEDGSEAESLATEDGSEGESPANEDASEGESPANEDGSEGESPESIYEAVSEAVELTPMVLVDEEFIENYYGINISELDGFVFAMAESPIEADTIAILRAKDSAEAASLEESLSFIREMKEEEMRDYAPEAWEVAAAGKVGSRGRYVFLVMAPEVAKITELIESRIG